MWKKLDIDDLKMLLAQDEIDKLNELSLDSEISAVIDDTIEMVSDVWRGALGAKGYTLDVREHFIPPSYKYWVLVHARHACWSRFPNSNVIAMDEVRQKEYEKAMELLKNPYLDCSQPDYSEDPELSGKTFIDGKASIYVPLQRFPDTFPLVDNFSQPTMSFGDTWR